MNIFYDGFFVENARVKEHSESKVSQIAATCIGIPRLKKGWEPLA